MVPEMNGRKWSAGAFSHNDAGLHISLSTVVRHELNVAKDQDRQPDWPEIGMWSNSVSGLNSAEAKTWERAWDTMSDSTQCWKVKAFELLSPCGEVVVGLTNFKGRYPV